MNSFHESWVKMDYEELQPPDRLTREIKDFVEWIEPTPDEAHIRYFTIMKYTKFIEHIINNCNFEPITKKGYKNKKITATVVGQGSSFTNCFLPNSDIDLIILGLPEDINISDCLYKIVNQLYHSKLISFSIVLKHAKVPIAKIIDRQFDIHIDISIGQINGALNIPRVLNYFKAYPLLRPLLLLMKVFLLVNDIHDPAKGGFGSNHMMLIIIFVIQKNPGIKMEGELLIALLEFLTKNLNIFLTGISTNNGGYFFSKFKIDFEKRWPHTIICQDPQYPDNYYGIRSKQSLSFIESCQKALNAIFSNFSRPALQSQGQIVKFFNSPNSASSTDEEFGGFVLAKKSLLSTILTGVKIVEKRRSEFRDLAVLWRLPPKEYSTKMTTKDQFLRSKSMPNFNEKNKAVKGDDRKLRNDRDAKAKLGEKKRFANTQQRVKKVDDELIRRRNEHKDRPNDHRRNRYFNSNDKKKLYRR